jgi:hypothetical protein
VEKCGTAGQGTYDDTIRRMLTACWITKLHTHTHTHTHAICNTYCFPTTTVVTRMLLYAYTACLCQSFSFSSCCCLLFTLSFDNVVLDVNATNRIMCERPRQYSVEVDAHWTDNRNWNNKNKTARDVNHLHTASLLARDFYIAQNRRN